MHGPLNAKENKC